MQVKRKTDDYLAHHGVKGQRWGVRRYQNADGTLTEAGKKKLLKYQTVENNKLDQKENAYINSKLSKKLANSVKKVEKMESKYGEDNEKVKKQKIKTAKLKNTFEKGLVSLAKERAEIKSYKLSDYMKEENSVRKNKAAGYLTTALLVGGTIGISALSGGAFAIPTTALITSTAVSVSNIPKTAEQLKSVERVKKYDNTFKKK